MKKYYAIAFISLLILMLCSCNNQETGIDTTNIEETTQQEENT